MQPETGIETQLLHAGQAPDETTGSRAVPIYQTTSYVFRDTRQAADLFALKEFGNIYTRMMNPTNDVVEKRIAALEGGTGGLLTSSGMAAIFLGIHNLASAGDHIVASTSLYGGTETLFRHTLARIGIEVTFLEEFTAEKVRAAIRPETRLVYGETIGNPKGDVPDLRAIADAAHADGVAFMVDNTFAPVLCRPIEHGADIVVHSCTKWIGGHGTSIGGVLIDSGNFDWSASPRYAEFTTPDPSYHDLVYWDAFGKVPGAGNIAYILKARVQGMRNIGMCPSPFNAFLFLQGLETLALRMQRHCDNAMALANWLGERPDVLWVNYAGRPDHPWHANARRYLSGGFGGVFGFGIRGGRPAGERFINALKLVSHLANVGDAKTLALHPASTTHQQLSPEAQMAAGVRPESIRVSVGLESIEDIKADLDQALRKAVE